MPRRKQPTIEVRGAKCRVCGDFMLVADGCVASMTIVLKDGTRCQPIPYGDDREYRDINPELAALLKNDRGRCHDCGAKPGHNHHPGCDVERCPVCGHQAIGCDHMDGSHTEFRVIDMTDKPRRAN